MLWLPLAAIKLRHLLWTAAAQVAQSGASFFATLTWVNVLAPSDFGVYAAILTVWMIALSAHRAVLGEQLIAGSADVRGYLDFVTLWGSGGVLLSAALGYLLGGPALLAAAVYCALFVVTDALRYERFAATGRRGSLTYINAVEVLRTAVSAAALLLALTGLGLMLAVWLVVASASIWPLLNARHLLQFRLRRSFEFLSSLGRFEGAMSLQFALGTGSAQLIPLAALGAFGPAAFGHLKLAQSLLGPVALLGTAFSPGLVRMFSSRERSLQKRLLVITLGLAVGAGAAVVSIWVAGLYLVGPQVTPGDVWVSAAALILPSAASMSLVLVGQPGSALLRVRRYASVAIRGQAVGVSVTLLACLIALNFSLVAFAWSMVLGSVATVGVTYYLLLRRVRADDPSW